MIESISDFYKRIQNSPAISGYSKEKEYFDVQPSQCRFGKTSFSYRDFYKVGLVMDTGKLYYADRWILVDRPAILFSNPLIPYAWEYVQCTECQYCMPCPYGLDIPGIFGHYNRIVSSDKRLKSSKDENYKEARRAFLVGYDRSVPKLRQANHCIGCEICKPHCPQTIDIPNEMKRIDLYAEQLKQMINFSS